MTESSAGPSGTTRKVTRALFASLKAPGQPAVFLTTSDFARVTVAKRVGVDMLLIGRSATMVMLGQARTVTISIECSAIDTADEAAIQAPCASEATGGGRSVDSVATTVAGRSRRVANVVTGAVFS